MKSLRLFFAAAVVFLCVAPRSFACSTPTSTGISNTWPSGSVVQIFNVGGVPQGDVSTAMSNWNLWLNAQFAGCAPALSLTASTGPNITMLYTNIAPPASCPTCTARGKTVN